MNLARTLMLTVAIVTGALSAHAADGPGDAALKAAVAGSQRAPASVSRDGARHPVESLAFWGLKPNQTVLEIFPGGGYWLEILAPYAKATGGTYIATESIIGPNTPEAARKRAADVKAKYADPAYGTVRWTPWTGAAGSLGAPGSVDLLLTARNIHDFMWTPGLTEKVLKDFHDVLKPGGILAIEDHRADPRPQVPNAQDGYVSTSVMVAMVEKAGFKLEASSEINANPKDTKDYPLGVWTLPPTSTRVKLGYIATWPGQQPIEALRDAAEYVAIGESDRMTLRFRKPN